MAPLSFNAIRRILVVSVLAIMGVLSFLSLTLAGNRGVRSLGTLVVVGLIAVFAAAVTLLPIGWAAGGRRES